MHQLLRNESVASDISTRGIFVQKSRFRVSWQPKFIGFSLWARLPPKIIGFSLWAGLPPKIIGFSCVAVLEGRATAGSGFRAVGLGFRAVGLPTSAA